jgi:hypothetical protein
MQTETERNDGYKRLVIIPLALIFMVMFFIYDTEFLPIIIMYETIAFSDLSTPQFLTPEQRNFAGQLLFSVFCSAYICTCIILLCVEEESDTKKAKRAPSTIRLSEQLRQTTLGDAGIFIASSVVIIMLGYFFWVLGSALIGIVLFVILGIIESAFQVEMQSGTIISNATHTLMYIVLLLICIRIFFSLYELRKINKKIITL